jgi:hypothetical protein
VAGELFSDGRLADVLNEHLDRAASVVEELPATSLKRRKTAVEKAVEQLAIAVPDIKRGKAAIEVGEGHPITVRFRVPYAGDPAMFTLRPTEYSLAPPLGDVESEASSLAFVRDFEVGTTSDDITAWAAKTADSVEQYLYWQAADVGMYQIELAERVEALVQQRRERLSALGDLQAELDEIGDV